MENTIKTKKRKCLSGNVNVKRKKLKSILKNTNYIPPPPPPLTLRRIVNEGKFVDLIYIDILEKYQLEEES